MLGAQLQWQKKCIPVKFEAGLGPLEPGAARVEAEPDFIRLKEELPDPLPVNNMWIKKYFIVKKVYIHYRYQNCYAPSIRLCLFNKGVRRTQRNSLKQLQG